MADRHRTARTLRCAGAHGHRSLLGAGVIEVMLISPVTVELVPSYVGENFDARRFQRFLYKGLGTPRAGTIPPTTIVR